MAVGHVFKIEIPRPDPSLGPGHWIVLEEKKTNVFHVLCSTLSMHEERRIAFRTWDALVQDLDAGKSPVSREYGASCHLHWRGTSLQSTAQGVHGHDTELLIVSPSIEEIEEMLTHVVVTTYDPSVDLVTA